MKLVEKKEFMAAVFDLKKKTFAVHIAFLVISNANKVYPSCKAPIASFWFDETLITIFLEYSNFVDIILTKQAPKLLKYIEINNDAIDLVDSKLLSFEPIYSLGRVELKTFKT